jgi:hypothetical protein
MGRGTPGGRPQNLKKGPGPGRPKGSKNKITKEQWEKETRHIAFSNLARAFRRTKSGTSFRCSLRDFLDMPEDFQRAVSSVKVRTENLTPGDDAQDTTIEIKLWDKTKALELGARANGWLKDKTEITMPEDMLSILDRAKARARGEG